ncbi:DUF1173 family protein [Xanthomonas axonopodis pv. nakataecorchori]|uniref:DUF1173 family protein n=1 Tax=Xanthomonas axonopodis TaxID=53413 RepID=UPI0035313AEA
MHTFLLDGYELDSAADESQGLLGKAHASKSRLLCMCTRPPQEMYVAKVGQRFYVKRMPNTRVGRDSCKKQPKVS